MDSFGTIFKFTSFGESHGACVGGVIEGIPAGLACDLDFINNELARRRGGSRFATPRKESDEVEFLSGVFEGVFTGTACGFIIKNSAQKSGDYDDLRGLFRPSHADFGYFVKYGVRDHRGGGRASARESAVRVVAGAVAALLLREFGISVRSGVWRVGAVEARAGVADGVGADFDFADGSEIFFLDPGCERAAKEEILCARAAHDSVGGAVLTLASGVGAGLGEPLYDKLDGRIGAAFLGLNGVKAVEIGAGVAASAAHGRAFNDQMRAGGEFGGCCGGGRGANLNLNKCGANSNFGERGAKNSGSENGANPVIASIARSAKRGNPNEDGANSNLHGANAGANGAAGASDRTDGANASENGANAATPANGGKNRVAPAPRGFFGRGNFATNHSGGILGGISTGEDIVIKTHFKPTASIFAPQRTLDTSGREVAFELKGRHDPCIAVRGSVVLTAMLRCILADFLLLNQTTRLDFLR